MDIMVRLIELAREFLARLAGYELTPLEERVLTPFFTNTKGKVFIIHHLPENMVAVLMAMYSRMNNPRGIRGAFLDNFLPSVLATLLPECRRDFDGDAKTFLDHHQIKGIDDFYSKWPEALEEFMRNFEVDQEYLEQVTASDKMKVFLNKWLDAYGHNSIARVGAVHICFEGISILSAKSLEWNRPGSAFIELSTRYVKMSGADSYPIWLLLAEFGMDQDKIQSYLQKFFHLFQSLQGDEKILDGPFPRFLRQQYGALILESKKLEMGVFGETCDVLGNLLPAPTLTSVGITVSGEALSPLLKHLTLDNTAENHALVKAIIAECKKTGADQFIAHAEVTEWDAFNWHYLRQPALTMIPPRGYVEQAIFNVVGSAIRPLADFDHYIRYLATSSLKPARTQYGKLGRPFELVTATFAGVMSFRGWRDLQRMGMATHFRGHVNPHNGFYVYDKPAPMELEEVFREAHQMALEMWEELEDADVPLELREYLMPLGVLVDYVIAANLRQCEFMNWQRSKPSANHEVRVEFLKIEMALREAYPWWADISRANITPTYAFARGSEVPVLLP